MEIELQEINVTLSKNQKRKIRNAFINRERIRLRLSKDALRGKDTLLVPTSFFKMRDGDDPKGIESSIDEETLKEMRNEMLGEITTLGYENSLRTFERLKSLGDEKSLKTLEELKSLRYRNSLKSSGDENYSKTLERLESIEGATLERLESLRCGNLSDELLESNINRLIGKYYGLFFDLWGEKWENKGIEFNLDYSFLNDLAEDFVKDNIKNFFECGADCH